MLETGPLVVQRQSQQTDARRLLPTAGQGPSLSLAILGQEEGSIVEPGIVMLVCNLSTWRLSKKDLEPELPSGTPKIK
jgi:hypothetical protein